jgi:hypothetical protein
MKENYKVRCGELIAELAELRERYDALLVDYRDLSERHHEVENKIVRLIEKYK